VIVNLTVQLEKPVTLGELREGALETLRELLCGTPVPPLEVHEMSRGEADDDDVIGADHGEMFVLSIFGSGDVVDILETHVGDEPAFDLTFAAGRTGSASEHALALAAAIFAARSFRCGIEDGWGFWAGDRDLEPEALARSLRLAAPRETFFLACQALLAGRAEGSGAD